MYCPRCGTQNDDNNYKCVKCQEILHPAPPKVVVQTDDLAGLIPYKNSPALIAYYLGVFSLIPLVGVLLGIPAFFLGLKGLRVAREHPEARGKAHAWVGILVGGFFGLLYLILILWWIVAVVSE